VSHNLLGSLSFHELFEIFHKCTDTQVCQVSKSRSFNTGVLQNVAAVDKKHSLMLFMTVRQYFLVYCSYTEIVKRSMFLLSPYNGGGLHKLLYYF
jgi:hypothetical protein